jgi:hypothetical protein
MEFDHIMKCLEVDEQICSIVLIPIIYFEVIFPFTDIPKSFSLFYLGFFPFWSVVLIALALLFLTIAVIGLIGYFLGCRRPTPEELYGNEFEQITPDDEFLLGGGGITNTTDSKTPTNGYYTNNMQRDFRYESSPRTERTRIGQSDEDMV